jgi:chemotaxis protein CheX
MPEASTLPKPYHVEEFLSPATLDRADATITEIFSMMFGFDTEVVNTASPCMPSPERGERTAIVGFSGAMRGSCQISMTSQAARSIASAMLGGAPIEEGDESINDALGELCNMLAGGWKNGVPGLSSECALSPPTVISGRDYKVHMSKPSVKVSRIYQFDVHALYLTLCCEDVEALPLG